MKIRYALLGPIVATALTPGLVWADPAASTMDNSLQQRVLSAGASEQQGASGPLGPNAGALSKASQGVAVGPSLNSANRGIARTPAARAQPSFAPAAKASQHAAVQPLHSPQAAKNNLVGKVPGPAALPASAKARASGPTVAQHRNAAGAVSSVQNGGPMPTRPGAGTFMAREPQVLSAPRPGSSSLGGGTPSAPANVVARHSPVSAAVGGAPASYEPPRNATLAVIGGTMMKRNKL